MLGGGFAGTHGLRAQNAGNAQLNKLLSLFDFEAEARAKVPLDTRVTLFGQELPFPLLLAPTGGQRFLHPRSAKGPVWFQRSVQKDRAFTRDLVQRAEGSGCRALCVTVDFPCPTCKARVTWTPR